MNHEWDIFIAHAGPDKKVAERLYDLLAPHLRVFLDSRSLMLGDDWDTELPNAQRKSLVTVVLVSEKTDAAYYQREEVAAAIALARQDKTRHRVVPIFLSTDLLRQQVIPYGLRVKHGITISRSLTLADAAKQLTDLANALLGSETPAESKAPSIVEIDRQIPSLLAALWAFMQQNHNNRIDRDQLLESASALIGGDALAAKSVVAALEARNLVIRVPGDRFEFSQEAMRLVAGETQK